MSSGIIPAYAGSTVEPSEMLTAQKDHPRIRGEHATRRTLGSPRKGSSPHTRGARHAADERDAVHRIIPAYVGSTSCRVRLGDRGADHPRIRGEHDKDPYSDEALAGSSPHTRGARDGRDP